jgi:hypothetical protein
VNLSAGLNSVHFGPLYLEKQELRSTGYLTLLSHKSFCARFKLPVYLNTDTLQGIKAATAQGRLFALYELGNFQQKAKSVNAKLWAVDKMHETNNMNPPFAENRSLKRFIKVN